MYFFNSIAYLFLYLTWILNKEKSVSFDLIDTLSLSLFLFLYGMCIQNVF